MNNCSLSELANILMGQSPEGDFCGESVEGIPLLNGPAEFTNYYPIPVQYTSDPKRECEKGDVLFCVRGSTTGRMNWADRRYAIGRGLAAISHKKGRDYNHFLKYLIQNNLEALLKNTNGSTFPNLTGDLLSSFKVTIPSDQEQRKISHLLSAIDTKIELNNRINTELEAMAKTLYDYWFVQFDFPDKNGKPYKSSGGEMIYNKAIQREIPKGWEVQNLSSFAKTSSGGTPLSTRNDYYDNGVIPWINSGEVNNPYIVSCKNHITELGLRDSSAKIFPVKTILVAMYGATAGKVSLQMIEACTNQAICAVNTNSPLFTYYLKFALSDLYDHLINLSSGSARDNLSQNKINELKFIIPNEVFIVEFNKITDPVIEKIILHIKENQQLTQLRDWLLPMLMNGQVRVV